MSLKTNRSVWIQNIIIVALLSMAAVFLVHTYKHPASTTVKVSSIQFLKPPTGDMVIVRVDKDAEMCEGLNKVTTESDGISNIVCSSWGTVGDKQETVSPELLPHT